VADPDEACDGTDLAGASCGLLGYYGGSLACQSDCKLELSSCEEAGWCGDGSIQPDENEECDDGNELDEDGCNECRIDEILISSIDEYWGHRPHAVSVDDTGRARVIWTTEPFFYTIPDITIAYRDFRPSGTFTVPELVFDLVDPSFPAEIGFIWPDLVLVEYPTAHSSLIVFQECCEEAFLEEPLDGSGTGVFRLYLPSAHQPDMHQVNAYTTGDQVRPRVAALHSGESVVVWQSDGQDQSGWGVYAQAYSRDGTPLSPEVQVNEATAGDQRRPDVALLEDGGFVVVWESFDEAEVSQGVLMRRFEPDGTPRSAETPVAEELPVDPGQQGPRVAAGVDGFVVVWQCWAVDGDGWGAFGRRFTTDGTPITGDLELAEQWQDDQIRPAVAMDGSGSFVAVWEDRSSGDWYVRGRRFESTGQAMGPEIEVSRHEELGRGYPDIDMTPDGRFVVAWNVERIFAQRFLPDGTPIGMAPW